MVGRLALLPRINLDELGHDVRSGSQAVVHRNNTEMSASGGKADVQVKAPMDDRAHTGLDPKDFHTNLQKPQRCRNQQIWDLEQT